MENTRSSKIQQNWNHTARDTQSWIKMVTERGGRAYDRAEEWGIEAQTPAEEDRHINLLDKIDTS